MSNLYFITGNKDKFAEVQALIPNVIQKEVDLPEVQELDIEKIIKHKLDYAAKLFSEIIIVEDSYLNLNALNGFPGPLAKWFYKAIGNDGIFQLCEKYGIYDAEIGVTIGLFYLNSSVIYFTGSMKGKIVKPRGTNGFAVDPIFQPEGMDKTFAEMSFAEKAGNSMRQIAVKKLKTYLETHDLKN